MDDVVTHLPPVKAPELAAWFRAADVVVMPSYSESFGLVALEAQACGTPVVATRVGGLSRAIFHGRTGLLVDGHHAADWADAFEALYDDPATRADMGRAAAIRAQNSGLAPHRRHHAGKLPRRRRPAPGTSLVGHPGCPRPSRRQRRCRSPPQGRTTMSDIP